MRWRVRRELPATAGAEKLNGCRCDDVRVRRMPPEAPVPTSGNPGGWQDCHQVAVRSMRDGSATSDDDMTTAACQEVIAPGV